MRTEQTYSSRAVNRAADYIRVPGGWAETEPEFDRLNDEIFAGWSPKGNRLYLTVRGRRTTIASYARAGWIERAIEEGAEQHPDHRGFDEVAR